MHGVMVLMALTTGAEPTAVQLDVVIARMRPGASKSLKRLLLRRPKAALEYNKEGEPRLIAGVVARDRGKLMARLRKLEARGDCKLLAHPRLVTKSGQPASFLDGDEQAVPVPAGPGQVGVQFEEFGTRVNFLPIVLGNGHIHLEVEPEVSEPSPNGTVIISGVAVQGRITQRVFTIVELESGQTHVIGGLYQKLAIKEKHAVPGLCELPLVGGMFRWESTRHDEYEVMVLVTPRVVK